jgi:D-alanyl-D-alanine carboxypeptidase
MSIYLIIPLVLIVLILAFVLLAYIAKRINDRKSEEDVLRFISNNSKLASLFVIDNGEVIVDFQSNTKMPLASVIKIPIAVEFAEQAADHTINVAEMVSLSELERFYIPGSDGYAHLDWLEEIQKSKKIMNNCVSLLEVGRGMMQFSSNANTEYLLNRLGLDSINNRLHVLNLSHHDPIYPISSAILLPSYIANTELISIRKALTVLQAFTYEEYAHKATELFKLICNDGELLQRLNNIRSSKEIYQRVWSDKQPRSTTKEYAQLLRGIQNGVLLSEEAKSMMSKLMEYEPSPGSEFVTIGRKGGSTLTIYNQTVYTQDRNGNEIQLAVFIHEPKSIELMWLEEKLDPFIHKFLNDLAFKNKVIACSRKEVANDGVQLPN